MRSVQRRADEPAQGQDGDVGRGAVRGGAPLSLRGRGGEGGAVGVGRRLPRAAQNRLCGARRRTVHDGFWR